MTQNGDKQLILDYLKNHYQKRGKDFFFKSKHIKLPIDNRVKGRLCKQLVKEGKIDMWSPRGCNHDLTFVTVFKNNGES